jgi:hypothetical protein
LKSIHFLNIIVEKFWKEGNMNEPKIMAWTVMPFSVVAKAWTDSTFKSALLAEPNDILRAALWELPWGNNFIIHEESGNQRYLPLPKLPDSLSAWTEEQILNVLIGETLNDVKLQYYLPARVVNKAFFEPTFKSSLLSDADSALTSMGTAPQGGQTFTVYENDATNRHLALPQIPVEWVGLSYSDVLERLSFHGEQTSIVDLAPYMHRIIAEDGDFGPGCPQRFRCSPIFAEDFGPGCPSRFRCKPIFAEGHLGPGCTTRFRCKPIWAE